MFQFSVENKAKLLLINRKLFEILAIKSSSVEIKLTNTIEINWIYDNLQSSEDNIF